MQHGEWRVQPANHPSPRRIGVPTGHRHPASVRWAEARPLCHARGGATPRARLTHSTHLPATPLLVLGQKIKKERKERRCGCSIKTKRNGVIPSLVHPRLASLLGFTSYEFSNSQQIRTYSYSRYFSSYITARFPLIIMQTKKGTPRGSLGWIG